MNKLLLSLLGALIALPAFARDFTYKYGGKTLTYTVINEAAKTCSTKKGSNYSAGNKISGELIIPSVAKDGETEYRVTEIGDQSFAICTGPDLSDYSQFCHLNRWFGIFSLQ